jgi:hypothetical protein
VAQSSGTIACLPFRGCSSLHTSIEAGCELVRAVGLSERLGVGGGVAALDIRNRLGDECLENLDIEVRQALEV